MYARFINFHVDGLALLHDGKGLLVPFGTANFIFVKPVIHNGNCLSTLACTCINREIVSNGNIISCKYARASYFRISEMS